ncbi:ABC transporter ATP-binding protein [Aquincola sp. S2]|uniref:ABC transporter ATP-binding protein n=1 Tax=Pseudaquabacterium terrae TaxID=2732868 RepID=A0ABX2EEQ9_9BURK|nr:ABC transporter ATP-binding protein [Aquabacterium terrae]NRF67088.1 ABC transporter ATP-binding protein [Aquabacterium terrae]
MLDAQGLTKSFGQVTALHPLDLQVGAGEIVCLLGANGAGKTTTLNLFLGFLTPTGGTALVDGIDVAKATRSARRALAYIPEQVALYPSLSGLENLAFFDRMAGGRRRVVELVQLLERVGLDAASAGQAAGTYSKGMRQKVGIAIALAKDARCLLLDEPLSGLDPMAANAFCGLLAALGQDGRAVLMATHDLFRAKEVGTRIGIMKQGRLVEQVSAATVDARELERIYLDHMKMPREGAT